MHYHIARNVSVYGSYKTGDNMSDSHQRHNKTGPLKSNYCNCHQQQHKLILTYSNLKSLQDLSENSSTHSSSSDKNNYWHYANLQLLS
jgi:hypothetical protein